MKLNTEHIAGQSIAIEVDALGHFSADFDDQSYSAPTKVELMEKLTKAVKKAAQQGSVDVTVIGIVPVTTKSWGSGPFESGDGFVHAKLRAKHERQHRTWLLISDDLGVATEKGKAQRFQVSGTREGTIVRRLTDEETARYAVLCERRRLAVDALEAFVGGVQIDPAAALDKAVAR